MVIVEDSNGKLYSWGKNDIGQLGNGTTQDCSMPVCISDIENSPLNGKNIIYVYTNGSTTFAKDSNGNLYSWGFNGSGELGDGTKINSSLPICISNIEKSEIKNKNIKNIKYYSGSGSGVYYYLTEDGRGYMYSYRMEVPV